MGLVVRLIQIFAFQDIFALSAVQVVLTRCYGAVCICVRRTFNIYFEIMFIVTDRRTAVHLTSKRVSFVGAVSLHQCRIFFQLELMLVLFNIFHGTAVFTGVLIPVRQFVNPGSACFNESRSTVHVFHRCLACRVYVFFVALTAAVVQMTVVQGNSGLLTFTVFTQNIQCVAFVGVGVGGLATVVDMGCFQCRSIGIESSNTRAVRGFQCYTAEILQSADTSLRADGNNQLGSRGTGSDTATVLRSVKILDRIYFVASLVFIIPLIAQRSSAVGCCRNREENGVVVFAKRIVFIRITVTDLGTNVLRLFCDDDRFIRIVAADGTFLFGIKFMCRFKKFFFAQAALLPMVVCIALPIAYLVGMLALAVALAAHMVGFALIAIKAVVIFSDTLDTLVADRAVEIVFVTVITTCVVAVLVCIFCTAVTHTAVLADGCVFVTSSAFGAMIFFVGTILAHSAVVAQVYAVTARTAVGTQIIVVGMLKTYGTVGVRFAGRTQSAFVTVFRAIRAEAAAIAQHRSSPSAASTAAGAVSIFVALHAFSAIGAGIKTFPANTAADVELHAFIAHAATRAGLACVFVALQALFTATFANSHALEALAAALADGGNAVYAKVTFHATIGVTRRHSDDIRSVAVVAVGAIIEVIMAITAVEVIFAPSRTFFNAVLATIARKAKIQHFALIIGIQQASSAVRANIKIMTELAGMLITLAAHSAAAIIASAAHFAELFVARTAFGTPSAYIA